MNGKLKSAAVSMEAFCLAIESGGIRTSLDTSLGVKKPRFVHDFQGQPALFVGFATIDSLYYWANAAAVLVVTFVLNAKEQNVSNPSLAAAH